MTLPDPTDTDRHRRDDHRRSPVGTLSESDQRLLNSILMREDEPLTTELIRGAVDALRRRKLERHQREIRSRIAEAEKRQELQGLPALLQEKVRIDRQLAGIGQP